jgi:hypothetical protein
MVVVHQGFPHAFPLSINRQDLVSAVRLGERRVEITYLDRPWTGDGHIASRVLTMRNAGEAEGLVATLSRGIGGAARGAEHVGDGDSSLRSE